MAETPCLLFILSAFASTVSSIIQLISLPVLPATPMLILSLVTIASNITYLLSEGGGASPLAIPSKDEANAKDEDYEEYIMSEDQMAQLLLEGAPERSGVAPAWQDTREELPIR